ncbi:MAG: hypothetical protein U0518_00345 [Candidatus Gracilibacteria bacterium]
MYSNFVSLHDILTNQSIDNTNIRSWIENNIEKEATLQTLLAEIQNDPKYFHIFLEYAEISIRKWNYVHPQILGCIRYLCLHFRELSNHNSYITDFLNSYQGDALFANKQTLECFTGHDPEKLDEHLLYRLVSYFISYYHKNLLLQEKTPFFQKALETVAKIAPERIHDLIEYRIEILFEYFNYSLKSGYDFYFSITKTGGKRVLSSDKELAYLKRLGEDAIFSAIKSMDFDLFTFFIDRFADATGSNGIHFLGFQDLLSLENEKRFYLSIIYKTLLFDRRESHDFLRFVLNQMNKRKGKIFIENRFGGLENVLSLMRDSGISIFESIPELTEFVSIVDANETYIWSFCQYIDLFYDQITLKSERNIVELLHHTNIQHTKFKKKLYDFITVQLLRYHGLRSFLAIQEQYNLIENPDDARDIKKMLLDTSIYHLKRQSYTTLEKYLSLLFTSFQLHSFEMESLMTNISQGNGKMKYILMRVVKKRGIGEMSPYSYRSIKEKCFFQSHFPLSIYHMIKRITEKK